MSESGGCAAERPANGLEKFTYGVLKAIFPAVFKLLFRFRVENPPKLEGAYVLAANHQSFIDPMVLGAAAPRRVTFMMTVLHFRSRTLGWLFRLTRAIPIVVRGPGLRDAMRAARKTLDRGEVVGIFPEGGMSRDGIPILGNPGAVSLALAKDVPVVPVWIDGAMDAMPANTWSPKFGRITIRFGEPVSRAELVGENARGRREELQAATTAIMERIAALGGQISRERWLAERASA